MNKKVKAILPALLINTAVVSASNDKLDDYPLDRIEAFSKISNIVEYYYPSDAVKNTDWEVFLKYGSHYIKNNPSQSFSSQLEHLFGEVAPHVTFNDYLTEPERLTSDSEVVGWLNYGYPGEDHHLYTRYISNINYGQLHTTPWLPQQQIYYTQLNGVYVRIPMLLTANMSAKDGVAFKSPDNISIPYSLENPFFCFSAMSKIWGVMEHFYQYFHHVPVDWKSELRPLLNACLTQDGQKIGDVLKYSLTKLQDNHLIMYSTHIPSEFHGPDVSFEMVDDKPILVYKGDSVAGLEIGDELIAVDGRSIDTLIEEKIPYSLVSTHVAKSIILGSQILSKAQETDSVTIDIKNKDNQLSSIQLPTDKYIFNSFYNGVDRYIHASQPTYQVLENNIHYINLSKTTYEDIPGLIEKLKGASGIVADLRSYPDDSRVWVQFIDAIHDGISAGPVFNLRVSNHPDYEQRYVQSYDLSIRGSKKVLDMPVVVMSNKYSISHNELTLAHFQNANVPIVGEVTMGINGDVTNLYFSGGGPKMLRIRFTGAEARQADGSKLIGVGVQPDIQVSPTREDIINNVDAVKRAATQYVESLIQQSDR